VNTSAHTIARASATAILIAVCAVCAVSAEGQTCNPSTSSNEAKIFGNRSLALAFGRGGAITDDAARTVRGGVEFVLLPHVSDATATPTTCRPGKGPENVNALPGVARVNVSVALPGHFLLAANWLPPVTLKDMTGDVLGLSLGYTHSVTASLMGSARVHTTFGHVTGPFTCPAAALRDGSSECFNGTRSNDRYEPNILGADVAVGGTPAGKPFAWYAGAGFERLSPRFQVHFLNAGGVLDTTRVNVDLSRVTGFGGASWAFNTRYRVSAEIFATPDDGATARLVWDVRFGR
jgi:hypothetical protein